MEAPDAGRRLADALLGRADFTPPDVARPATVVVSDETARGDVCLR
jgi:hypothetical protein